MNKKTIGVLFLGIFCVGLLVYFLCVTNQVHHKTPREIGVVAGYSLVMMKLLQGQDHNSVWLKCIHHNENVEETLSEEHIPNWGYCVSHMYVISNQDIKDGVLKRGQEVIPQGKGNKNVIALYPKLEKNKSALDLYIVKYPYTKEGAQKCDEDISANKSMFPEVQGLKISCGGMSQNFVPVG